MQSRKCAFFARQFKRNDILTLTGRASANGLKRSCRAEEQSAPNFPMRLSRPGFWWSCHPLIGDAWFRGPFCALPVAMNFDDGGVNHGAVDVRTAGTLRKSNENIDIDPIAMPFQRSAIEAEVSPQKAFFGNRQNSMSGVLAMPAGHLCRTSLRQSTDSQNP
ncbi:hypothetical protein [Hoeflea sp. IMCC20628]|uniref:hypothetical protein n=1 Tax=Hoeflea sp. IMCC20628 TaxID=1620421 RepID=UPI0012DFF784|nr:hypothetical protein [Hoeflea sp. IMCC20628]